MKRFLVALLVLSFSASLVFANGSQEATAKKEAAPETAMTSSGPWKPEKPIKIIVPFNAGGSSDVACRVLVDYLNKYSDVEFIVENLPGSGGQIGMEKCASSAPDGYTIVSIPSGWFMAYAMGNVTKTYTDYTPITTWADSFMALAVNSKSSYKTYADFIQAAKKGNLLIGGVAGTLPTLAEFVMADKEGFTFRFTDVDEKAKQTELLSNRVDAYIDAYASVVRYVESGDFNALMLFTNTQVPNTESIPKMKQLGYDMDPDFLAQRYSFWGPKNMNPEAAKYINNIVKQASEDPECKAALEKLFYGTSWMSLSDYNAYCQKVQNDTIEKVKKLF